MSTTNLNLDTIETTDSIQNAFLTKMNSNMQKLDSVFGMLKTRLLQKTGKDNLSDAIAYIDQLVNAQDGTITADKVFNGYIGYAGTNKITGTALATPSVGGANTILAGNKLYTSDGTLLEGNIVNKTGVSTSASGSVSGDDYRLQIPSAGYYTMTSYLTRAKSSVLNDLNVTVIPTINVTLTGGYAEYISGYGAGINKDGVLVIWAMSNASPYEHIKFSDTSIGAGTIGVGWNLGGFDTADPVDVPHACTVTGLANKTTIDITLNAYTNNTTSDYVLLNVTLTAS